MMPQINGKTLTNVLWKQQLNVRPDCDQKRWSYLL